MERGLGHPVAGMPKQDDRGLFALETGQIRHVATQPGKLDGRQMVSQVDAAKLAVTSRE
jgi:hypothetical protein